MPRRLTAGCSARHGLRRVVILHKQAATRQCARRQAARRVGSGRGVCCVVPRLPMEQPLAMRYAPQEVPLGYTASRLQCPVPPGYAGIGRSPRRASWLRRPRYDLRRASCDHPDFGSNASWQQPTEIGSYLPIPTGGFSMLKPVSLGRW